MGIVNRISTIVKANLNDLLDRAENPEVMLDQYIRDLENAVAEAREELINAMADEKRLAAKLEERNRQVRMWQANAEQAVQLGKDEAARSALRAVRAYQDEADTVSTAWQEQKDKVAEFQKQFELVEKKLVSVKGERDALLAKHRSTRVQEAVTTAKVKVDKAKAAIKGVERMKERLDLLRVSNRGAVGGHLFAGFGLGGIGFQALLHSRHGWPNSRPNWPPNSQSNQGNRVGAAPPGFSVCPTAGL